MELLQYLIGDLNYGGKIIYAEDKKIIKQTVKHFVNQELCMYSGQAQFGQDQSLFQYDLAR